jgi:hypothetical protein
MDMTQFHARAQFGISGYCDSSGQGIPSFIILGREVPGAHSLAVNDHWLLRRVRGIANF